MEGFGLIRAGRGKLGCVDLQGLFTDVDSDVVDGFHFAQACHASCVRRLIHVALGQLFEFDEREPGSDRSYTSGSAQGPVLAAVRSRLGPRYRGPWPPVTPLRATYPKTSGRLAETKRQAAVYDRRCPDFDEVATVIDRRCKKPRTSKMPARHEGIGAGEAARGAEDFGENHGFALGGRIGEQGAHVAAAPSLG